MKRALQAASTHPQQPFGDAVVPRRPEQLLTEREAADRCRYFDRGLRDPLGSFQRFARRAGIPVKYAGRARLYDPRILDAFLDRDPWTRRHRAGAPATTNRRRLSVARRSVG